MKKGEEKLDTYLPALIASTVSLREYVCETGSHMLDWPEQYHISPKATFEIFTDVGVVMHPLHTAVIV